MKLVLGVLFGVGCSSVVPAVATPIECATHDYPVGNLFTAHVKQCKGDPSLDTLSTENSLALLSQDRAALAVLEAVDATPWPSADMNATLVGTRTMFGSVASKWAIKSPARDLVCERLPAAHTSCLAFTHNARAFRFCVSTVDDKQPVASSYEPYLEAVVLATTFP